MIIDCHGHYTTEPKDLHRFRKEQTAAANAKDKTAMPPRAALKMSDDEIRESLEANQLKLQRERGTDVTIFSPRASGMGHHIGDESVSTEAQHADTIKKIGYGHKTLVSIVTTPSGTYSTDAIASPYVRYSGIDVAPARRRNNGGFWIHTYASNWGTYTSSGFSAGSITYYNSTFTPSKTFRR